MAVYLLAKNAETVKAKLFAAILSVIILFQKAVGPFAPQHASMSINYDYMRAAVFARDKGICAICKIDCREILEKIRSQEYSEETTIALFNAGFPHWRLNKASKKGIVLWDADHIIPIDQGGGGCGVQGMRTLCAACHWRVTRTQSILKNIPDPTKQITLWGSQLASEF